MRKYIKSLNHNDLLQYKRSYRFCRNRHNNENENDRYMVYHGIETPYQKQLVDKFNKLTQSRKIVSTLFVFRANEAFNQEVTNIQKIRRERNTFQPYVFRKTITDIIRNINENY